MGYSIARMTLSTVSKLVALRHDDCEQSFCHGFWGNRLSRPPRRSPYPSARVLGQDRIKAPGPGALSMTRSFNPSKPIFMTSDPSLMRWHGVVNAVSLYLEHGQETFHSVHVESAQRVAAQARLAGVERLVHVSGIGADAASPSLYIRKRSEGELAVRSAFANATVVRPAVMFVRTTRFSPPSSSS
jgi:hypothetical protein